MRQHVSISQCPGLWFQQDTEQLTVSHVQEQRERERREWVGGRGEALARLLLCTGLRRVWGRPSLATRIPHSNQCAKETSPCRNAGRVKYSKGRLEEGEGRWKQAVARWRHMVSERAGTGGGQGGASRMEEEEEEEEEESLFKADTVN